MEIQFQPAGRASASGDRKIIAARIINYLLEQSRVTTQTEGERGYHIFYQLCAGLSSELRAKFALQDTSSYHYLNQSSCDTVDGVSDSEDFAHTYAAMKSLNFSEEIIQAIWQLLVAILSLGNLKVQPKKDKETITEIANKEQLELTARLLGGFDPDVLSQALCYRSVTIRGSISMIPLNPTEVAANRDALAKTLYSKLFDNLVVRMNIVLQKQQGATGPGGKPAAQSDADRRAARSIGILG